MEFAVHKIAAWAPDKRSPDEWTQWVKDGAPILGDYDHSDKNNKPKTAAVPAMTRRRLTSWGAMALEVACQCAEHLSQETPTIFASRHGDTHRTYTLLEGISQNEALSPTAFSLSVHNSSSGMFSIVKKLLGAAIALAAGKDTLAQAFVEANNLLHQGHQSVLLVVCDEPLAHFYQPYEDEREHAHAFAMVLSKASAPEKAKKIETSPSHTSPAILRVSSELLQRRASPENLSMSMRFLTFWFSDQSHDSIDGARARWHFDRS